jgi:hypothetical protein
MKERGKVVMVPISTLVQARTRLRIPKAVVAYLDILGYSEKQHLKDRRFSQLDFSGALRAASLTCRKVRFNLFSDCAFLCSPEKNASDLLSAIRYAFTRWLDDGVLARGGIALGDYEELEPVGKTADNFVCDLFHGTGVVQAARLEHEGKGALLYTNKETAEFYGKKYREPIFSLNGRRIIGWSDDEGELWRFSTLSLMRLLRLLSMTETPNPDVLKHLCNNIRYSCNIAEAALMISLLVLSRQCVEAGVRRKAIHLLGIPQAAFRRYRRWIHQALAEPKRLGALEFVELLAAVDSSIPGFST